MHVDPGPRDRAEGGPISEQPRGRGVLTTIAMGLGSRRQQGESSCELRH